MRPETEALLDRCVHAGRRDLPRVRREWVGRRVAVCYLIAHGHSRKRTAKGWAWGVLEPVDRDDQIGVRTKDGLKRVHYTRVFIVYDLETEKP